jgi:O-antigen/teichoic acid export membrane protein
MATQAISILTEVLLSSLAAIADQGHRPALDGYLWLLLVAMVVLLVVAVLLGFLTWPFRRR